MKVVSLFDKSGKAVLPWAQAGFECYCYDLLVDENRIDHPNIHYIQGNIHDTQIEHEDVKFMFAFPPCTDLAVSGARWFASKAEANPYYREEAMNNVYRSRDIGEQLGCPYLIENPVSVISSEWRKPDHTFQPYQYTQYCQNDNYTKKTCLWTGGGFIMPPEAKDLSLGKPDDKKIHYMGKAKRNLLGVDTPVGFSLAVFMSNVMRINQ